MPVPSWREAEANDYLLVVMRDNGQEWADICEWWKDMTGLDTDVNTLRTRYVRLKFSKILEDDHVSCHPTLICRLDIHPINSILPIVFPKSPTPISPACCIG